MTDTQEAECVRVCGAKQNRLVSISQGRRSTHLLGGIDNSSVVAKLQGAKHCPSHGHHEAACQLLQIEKPHCYRKVWAQVTTGQGLGWQVPWFRYLA